MLGENAQNLDNNLLLTESPSKLELAADISRLDNRTYQETMTCIDIELELKTLQQSDDLPIAAIVSISNNT